MKTEQDIKPFAATLEAAQLQRLKDGHLDCETNIRNCRVSIRMGKKFGKVDVGTSGKYMVDLETGTIYGIKAYGVVRRGHRYGTLDTIHEWDWSGYHAVPKGHSNPLALSSAS